jgi:hypothetical protein
MIRRNQQMVVLPLAACLLLLPVLVSPASVAHELQHAHHKAATHSSALCSWLCGAGQGLEPTESVLITAIALLAMLDVESAERVDDVELLLFLSRGPPLRSL